MTTSLLLRCSSFVLVIYGLAVITIQLVNPPDDVTSVEDRYYVLSYQPGRDVIDPSARGARAAARDTGLDTSYGHFESRSDPHLLDPTTKLNTAPITSSGSTGDVTLTLFTTFRESPESHVIHKATIINWATLIPLGVRPILYRVVAPVHFQPEVDEATMRARDDVESALLVDARRRGWIIKRCPVTSADNVPVLRHMFLDAERSSNSSYYGYANADILFDSRLLRTLSDIRPQLDRLRRRNSRGLLITGVRSDCVVDSRSPNLNRCVISSSSRTKLPSSSAAAAAQAMEADVNAASKTSTDIRRHVSVSQEFASFQGIGNSSRVACQNFTGGCSLVSTISASKFSADSPRRSRSILTSAQDYFVTVRSGMPWNSMPDLVVGRAGIDNWLLVTALVGDAVVVDAGGTVTARHQIPPGYRPSAHYDRRPGSTGDEDARLNYKLAGRLFDYSLGLTDCAPFYTAFNGHTSRRSNVSSSAFQRPRSPSRDARLVTSGETRSTMMIPSNRSHHVSAVDVDEADRPARVVIMTRHLNRYCKRALVKRGQNPRRFMTRNQLP